MRVFLGYGLGAVALVLGGCSDPKTPSEGNFAKAIDAYFAENPACIGAPRGGVTPAGQEPGKAPYPAYMLEKPVLDFGGGKQLDALVAAGLLKVTSGTVPVVSFGGNTDTAVKIYELTEAGSKAFSMKDPANRFSARFCYGTPQVDEVTRFTEPAAMMGATVSQANFTYHIKDQASWATHAALKEAFPNLGKTVGTGLADKAVLVLTNTGWVDSRMVDRPK